MVKPKPKRRPPDIAVASSNESFKPDGWFSSQGSSSDRMQIADMTTAMVRVNGFVLDGPPAFGFSSQTAAAVVFAS